MNERLKELRNALKMNQEDFGKLLGITKSGVSDIESGRRKVTDQHVIMLKSQKPSLNEDWLRNGSGKMFIELSIEEQLSEWVENVLNGRDSNFKRRFITMLMNLSEKEWEFIEKKALELAGDEVIPSSLQNLPQNDNELLRESIIEAPDKAI